MAYNKAANERYRERHPDRIKASQAKHDAKRAPARVAYLEDYRTRNQDRIKQTRINYRANCQDRIKASRRRWYESHKESHAETVKAWRIANADFWKEYQRFFHNDRREKIKSSGRLSRGLVQTLLMEQDSRCPYCPANLIDGFDLDHYIPIARGGLNVDDNIQLLCGPCNRAKGAKDPLQFLCERMAPILAQAA